jgi:hypothetical protein
VDFLRNAEWLLRRTASERSRPSLAVFWQHNKAGDVML